MKKAISIMLALSMLFCFGCAAGDEESLTTGSDSVPTALNTVKNVETLSFDKWYEQRENMPVEDSSYSAMASFAAKTAAKVLVGADSNANFSPFSLYYALAMAANGANGTTKDELLGLLGFSDAETLAEQCGNMYRNMVSREREGNADFMIADSLWLSEKYNGEAVTYNEDFLNTCAEQFYAEVFSADFTSEETAENMKKWIKAKTNGTIEPNVDIDPETLLSIINTLYLKDEWTSRFDKDTTTDGEFTRADGQKVSCSYMNAIRDQGFIKGENYTAAGVSMKNFGSMWFILPNEGVSTDDILLDESAMATVFAGSTTGYGDVTFAIPKFEFSSSFDLVEALNSLGVTEAFADTADFSGISDMTAGIGSVKQETYIAIDENGVEASAYTELDYSGAAMPTDSAELILDRPFIFAITNGTVPLFIGVVNDPSAN